jgi:hypothetical protein
MPMPPGMEQDLGSLINELNPYTENNQILRGPRTGAMDIYTGAAAPGGPARSQVRLETDNKYQSEWMFKGQAHRVSKAIRIRYRFPVMDADGVNVLYWTEDYLLIGFEGSNGSG